MTTLRVIQSICIILATVLLGWQEAAGIFLLLFAQSIDSEIVSQKLKQ